MKTIPLALIVFAAIGCGHNEFDVSPAQVNQHKAAPLSEGAGVVHLPPEAFTTGMKFKKGDRMPDGTIAAHDMELKASSDGKGDGMTTKSDH